MPAVFVHGVPDTHRLWSPLFRKLRRKDVTAVSLPGFGVATPAGFDATKEAYANWLIEQLAGFAEPVDLVGHDWGALLVQRVVSLRPDLVRSWACGSGPIDREYVWHDLAQQWQTPGRGEEIMAMAAPEFLEADLVSQDIDADLARESSRLFDPVMKDCILRLYRSAVNVGAEWQADLERVTTPALILWGQDDPYVTTRFAERLAARVGGRLVTFASCGHPQWTLENRPLLDGSKPAILGAAGMGLV